ncbi:alpha-L-fucosidase [Aliiglaciecola lipolytica]|uniref:alpha-L-fucosidase n=1 Tax=Aliiglaciecola lipolytica TaxID=477689 RepID=UPI001C08FA9C|nr:alpha-L-fucosidase [Aliiglaciecola lipolytica]MBU2877911.1 alpha-L-fucosidase [Aliiglaciecola lipolytica]
MKLIRQKLAVSIASALLLSSVMSVSVYAQDNNVEANQSMDELWGDSAIDKAKHANAERGEWFAQDKYSMFIHWGLFSIPAGEWKGKTYYGISEWLMSGRVADIPKEEYKELAKQFNPTEFDAKAIVQLAVDAGMKNIVITAKHHEGFAMYHSKSSTYDIEDASPYKRDPLKELADACAEAGIGLGFYYSQMQDWYEQGSASIPWSSEKQEGDFTEYFERKVIPQVTELLTEYGPIRTVWFDTPGDMTKEQSQKLVDLTRSLQPKAMINSRIGNGVGDFSTLGDHSLSQVNHPGLWETIDTTNNSWGDAWYDKNWKSGTEILHRLISTVARGGNYMLNIGPKGNGEVPEMAAKGLRRAGKWLEHSGETIYGAKGSPWGRAQAWGDITVKGNKLYLHVFDWPENDQIHLAGLKNQITSARLLNAEELGFMAGLFGSDEGEVTYSRQDNGWTSFTLAMDKPDSLVPVIVVELDGEPEVDTTIGIDPSIKTTINSVFANCEGCVKKEIRWMQKFGDWNYANNLLNWTDNGKGEWKVDVAEPGDYFIEVEYSADDVVDFSEWVFSFNGEILMMQALDTGERKNSKRQGKGKTLYRYRTDEVGVVTLQQGKQSITVTPKGKVIGGGINLRAIHLTPIVE